jgi:transposase InsO family protein
MRKSASFYFFKRKPIVLKDRYERWRGVADLLGFTTQERLRVEWMVFYYTVAEENATLTAQHFGISRKTFYEWLKRFKGSKYDVRSLANQSKVPRHKRKWEVTLIQEERIKRLRKKYPYYGKKKLKVIYEKEYSEEISTWKIERVIRRYKLYPNRNKAEKIARKRARARQKPKRRIRELMKEGRPCFLFQLDTIVVYWNNLKRYILTAVDHATKLGYARMYKNKSSRSAADFLYRLRYLVNQPIENLQTDNGSEFACEFERASAELGIQRYFSRIKTPQDNPEIERFNETLEYEWLYDCNLSLDPEELNPRLTEWLIEYNFNRPHQSLGYLAPIEYIEKELAKIHGSVLPMWSASTHTCKSSHFVVYLLGGYSLGYRSLVNSLQIYS